MTERAMTPTGNLLWLEDQLRSWPAGRQPARLEISADESGDMIAQLLADDLPVPLVGRAGHASGALADLRLESERAIKAAGRRRRRRS